ncbi:hypothetical protein LUZ60_009373 [Juncus effusus]|nr:hypothetical protein LUZ60_009373 [Juncus effusus]
MDGPSSAISKSSKHQLRRSVRVVAAVCCPVSSDGNQKTFSVSFDEGHASVSICNGDKSSRTTHKSTYLLDFCYEEEKEIDQIYTKEVKPLINDLFNGTNCCVISYGASSQLIQGLEENQSLAERAVSDILDWSNKNNFSVDISFYDVFQDHIYDLLRPNENELLVYEDSQRQVQLKGLSKVSLNTLDEFRKNYLEGGSHIRGHRGLIIYTNNTGKEDLNKHAVFSKINFLEFKGYGGAKVNKSLYSVMNVVHNLNCKNPISYRETKLTRFLQDFLSYKSGSLVIACLEQSENEENKRVLTLASRSSRASNRRHALTRIGAKTNIGQVNKSARKKPGVTTDSEQKIASMQGETEQTDTTSPIVPVMQELTIQEESEVTDKSIQEESEVMDKLSFFPSYEKNTEEESESNEASNQADLLCEPSEQEEHKGTESEPMELNNTYSDDSLVVGTPAPAPKLSDKLLEISNSLRLQIQQSSSKPKKVHFSSSVFEPKTPYNLRSVGCGTPHDSFKARTTGMKESLVQECLTYLNSANKDELKRLKGIGEIRATHILQLRANSPEPFKEIKDLQGIGVTPKQFHKMAMNFLEES